MVSPTLITAPIACVKSIEQMEQYVAGAKLQLDADAIEDLDQANSSF
jgi:aryl-alcohol dehydrogenase-like predicted oxidoreductase